MPGTSTANVQPTPELFAQTFGTFAAGYEVLGRASSAREYALGMEAAGAWLRLDPAFEPSVFHAATVSEGELRMVRAIREVVRLGRVRRIEADRMFFERGELAAHPDTLYVDCTAPSLARKAPLPVFAGQRITLQMIRVPQLPFSAALAAFLEATLSDDDEKNALSAAIRVSDTVEDYIQSLPLDLKNRLACSRHPAVREWISASRTDGFAKVLRSVSPDDAEKMAVVARLREAMKNSVANLPRLLATLDASRTLEASRTSPT